MPCWLLASTHMKIWVNQPTIYENTKENQLKMFFQTTNQTMNQPSFGRLGAYIPKSSFKISHPIVL